MKRDDCPLTYKEAKERLIKNLGDIYKSEKEAIAKEISKIDDEYLFFDGEKVRCAYKWNYVISCFFTEHCDLSPYDRVTILRKELHEIYEAIFGKDESSKRDQLMTSLRYYIEMLESLSEEGKSSFATQYDLLCLSELVYEILQEKS